MRIFLNAWREVTIVVLAVLLGMAANGMRLAETRRQDGVRQTTALQARHDDAVARGLWLGGKLAAKTQELQDWIDGASERELRMVQEEIKLSEQLNAYFEAFGPLPAKTADYRQQMPKS